jgi:hypothetical protein
VTHGQRLRHVFGSEHEARDGLERTTEIVEVEPCDDEVLAGTREQISNLDKSIVEELSLIDADDNGAVLSFGAPGVCCASAYPCKRRMPDSSRPSSG